MRHYTLTTVRMRRRESRELWLNRICMTAATTWIFFLVWYVSK